MAFTVYVIQNSATQALYKGQTADLALRLAQHNSGKTKSTRGEGTWRVVYTEEYKTREEALKREKYFKSAAGRRFLKKMLNG